MATRAKRSPHPGHQTVDELQAVGGRRDGPAARGWWDSNREPRRPRRRRWQRRIFAAKRRTAAPAASAPSENNTAPEVAVTSRGQIAKLAAENSGLAFEVDSGNVRETAQDQRIGELTDLVAALRDRLARRSSNFLPPPFFVCPLARARIADSGMVRVVPVHEQDLRDRVFDPVYKPRHLARFGDDLPPNLAGCLGPLRSRWGHSIAGRFEILLLLFFLFRGSGAGGRGSGAGDAAEHGRHDCGGGTGQGCLLRVHVLRRDRAAAQPQQNFGGYAFYQCTSLSEITLPSTLTEIGTFAFGGCTSSGEITLPPTLTEIGMVAFRSCTSLTEIVLQPNLTAIGFGALAGCTSLAEIVLPPGHVDVAPHALDDCHGTPRWA